ncbi:hypothetical protein K7I13_14335 [Brucepastera parasyntrophica]|uniref:hypothetical protein n=1 Tax=Brucepastera parasyntrophica TaxID=2880008 RepID=UPI00210A3481|nr:hypothetical protein [Brucepastera parasyntrophica]ULQ59619.1 hypothetical protein K7I13_14335 [Brucepastera parasyntrophica]
MPQTQPLPALDVPEAKISYPIIRIARPILPLAARALHFREPVILHPERLVSAYRDFQQKKIRLIVGFRHPYGDDPHLMAYLFLHSLPKAARKLKIKLKNPTHVHFVYGVEVMFWSGNFVRWLLPRVGALPVNHIHMDSKGMNLIRKTIANGPFPLALAPEGHVTYRSEQPGEIETGTARFCFWCEEDLLRENRDEEVIFLPLSQHYRYGKNAEKKLDEFLRNLELECGVVSGGTDFSGRLRTIGKAILETLQEFYTELSGKPCGNNQSAILIAALEACERILSVTPVQTDPSIARIYRVRAAGWDRIFRKDLDDMTPLRMAMTDRETGEAWYAMRHMEMSELLSYISLTEIPNNAHIEQYIEIANNFYDLAERIKGGTLRNRANFFMKNPVIVPGDPMHISEYSKLYKENKKRPSPKFRKI